MIPESVVWEWVYHKQEKNIWKQNKKIIIAYIKWRVYKAWIWGNLSRSEIKTFKKLM